MNINKNSLMGAFIFFMLLFVFIMVFPQKANALTCSGSNSITYTTAWLTATKGCQSQTNDFSYTCALHPELSTCTVQPHCGVCRPANCWCTGYYSYQCEASGGGGCSGNSYWVSDGCSCGGSSGGGTPPPSCGCGTQECDFSVPGCQCLYIGCKVGGVTGDNCVKFTCGSNPPPPSPSCIISLAPASMTIGDNSTTTFIASVTPSNGTITNVTFTSSTTGNATVSPASDSTVPYSTVATGVGVGSSTITASAVMSGSVRCSDSSLLIITSSDPWWQVKDADVVTNGDLRSGAAIPGGNYFNLVGAGGYPGVPAFGGSTNLTTSNVSVMGWLANSTYSSSKLFNSNYFFNAVPEETTPNIINIPSDSVTGAFFESGGTTSFGYYWYMYDGTATGLPLNITSAANLGSRKVILLVKGADLRLNSTINLNDGLGFFLAVTTGNITVAPTVGGGVAANLEGVYVADGSFSTGTTGTNSDTKLWVRGSVAAFGGMILQRDLADNSGPAELFEFAPDQELLFPIKLSYYPSAWREVAP